MKHSGLAVISLMVFGALLPLTTGLRCYECVSERGFEGEYFAPYDKKCKEGDLSDSLGVDCSVNNLRNPKTLKLLTPDEISVKQWDMNITWMCTKQQGKFEGQGPDVTVKYCDIHAMWDMPRDEVDKCEDETFDDGYNPRHTVKFCQCFNDLCNGSGFVSWLPVMTMVMSVIATCFY